MPCFVPRSPPLLVAPTPSDRNTLTVQVFGNYPAFNSPANAQSPPWAVSGQTSVSGGAGTPFSVVQPSAAVVVAVYTNEGPVASGGSSDNGDGGVGQISPGVIVGSDTFALTGAACLFRERACNLRMAHTPGGPLPHRGMQAPQPASRRWAVEWRFACFGGAAGHKRGRRLPRDKPALRPSVGLMEQVCCHRLLWHSLALGRWVFMNDC